GGHRARDLAHVPKATGLRGPGHEGCTRFHGPDAGLHFFYKALHPAIHKKLVAAHFQLGHGSMRDFAASFPLIRFAAMNAVTTSGSVMDAVEAETIQVGKLRKAFTEDVD